MAGACYATAIIVGLALVGTGGAPQARADCGTPCFADNEDILSGRRDLLPVDDLVWAYPVFNDKEELTTFANAVWESNDARLPADAVGSDVGPANPLSFAPAMDVGRVFALPYDVMVNVTKKSTSERTISVTDQQNSSNNWSMDYASNATLGQGAVMADFDRDGYQDVFVIDMVSARVFTAKCTNDPLADCTGTAGNAISDGMISGPQRTHATAEIPLEPVTVSGAIGLVEGDLNGDGILDVAWVAGEGQGTSAKIIFVSVCPAANVTVFGQSCSKALEIVAAPEAFDTKLTVPAITLAAGNFDGSGPDPASGVIDDELVVVSQGTPSAPATTVQAFSFDANMNPTPGPNPVTWDNTRIFVQLIDETTLLAYTQVTSGQLVGGSLQEQVVMGITVTGETNGQVQIIVVTFDSNLKMQPYGTNVASQYGVGAAYDITIGRFDPPPETNGKPDFNQQVGLYVYEADIFKLVDASMYVFAVTELQTPLVETSRITTSALGNTQLRAGDIQGRSLTLGAPSIVRIPHVQPDTVLAMPPGHIDYITLDGNTAPTPFNLSVNSNSFNTQYEFQDDTKTSSSRTTTTSYTASTTESFEQKISYGDPDADGISATFKEAATQTHGQSVSKQYTHYDEVSYSLQDGTSQQFGDQVAYTSRTMNVYTYPVIGQTVCAAGFTQVTINSEPKCCPNADVTNGTCTKPSKAVDPVPLTVQYSGPDTITHHLPMPAYNLEFFQPAYEVGQVLSYPANYTQLQADIGGLQPQSSTNPSVWSQQASDTTSVTWTQGQGQNKTTGTTSNHSFNASISVSGGIKVFGVGLSADNAFDYSKSKSTSSLNSNTTSSDASKGITVNRGIPAGGQGQSTNPAFQYNSQTFIFGQDKPPGSIQTDLPVDGDITFDGVPWVAFAATPYQQANTAAGTSGWWLEAYGSEPDIALTHPTRWTVSLTDEDPPKTQFLFNCPLGYTSSYAKPACQPLDGASPELTDCNQSNENNAANACAFYNMKGLFVTTNAGDDPGHTASSPQDAPTLASAFVGDKLTLRARVSNYSLKNMTQEQTVYVQFYAQPVKEDGDFEDSTAVFIGTSQFSGDELLAPCGGPGPDQPCRQDATQGMRNWTLAEVVWDTSTLPAQVKASDSYWYFWVVAWAQDSNGVVEEIAEHGVAFGALTNPTEAVTAWTSFIEVEVDNYSNNVGFYGQLFTLYAPVAEDEPTPPVADSLEIVDVTAWPERPLRRRYNSVRATLQANGGTADFVVTRFSKGNPEVQGNLFDINIIPRLQRDVEFMTTGTFQPDRCGLHAVIVEATPHQGGLPTAVGSTLVRVTTDPADDVAALSRSIGELALKGSTTKVLQRELEGAKKLFETEQTARGIRRLDRFIDSVARHSGTDIPADTAKGLTDETRSIINCL